MAELTIEHGDLKVGFTGHYGEFYELDEDDVSVKNVDSNEYLEYLQKPEKVVDLEMPYIGEEPD